MTATINNFVYDELSNQWRNRDSFLNLLDTTVGLSVIENSKSYWFIPLMHFAWYLRFRLIVKLFYCTLSAFLTRYVYVTTYCKCIPVTWCQPKSWIATMKSGTQYINCLKGIPHWNVWQLSSNYFFELITEHIKGYNNNL